MKLRRKNLFPEVDGKTIYTKEFVFVVTREDLQESITYHDLEVREKITMGLASDVVSEQLQALVEVAKKIEDFARGAGKGSKRSEGTEKKETFSPPGKDKEVL